jgi:hypothetical protein
MLAPSQKYKDMKNVHYETEFLKSRRNGLKIKEGLCCPFGMGQLA